jgi:hypothetical protein
MKSTVKITKSLIKKGRINLYHPNKCVGALALKKAFPKLVWISWGMKSGAGQWDTDMCFQHFQSLDSKTSQPINMMEISEPCEIIMELF